MPLPGRPTLPILLAGDAEADLDALHALLDGSGRLIQARGLSLACAALRRLEYAVAVADVSTVEEAFTILRAAGRNRPVTPVICLLPAFLDPLSSPASQRVHELAYEVRLHPIEAETLRALVADAAAAPRLMAPAPARGGAGEWEQEEGVA